MKNTIEIWHDDSAPNPYKDWDMLGKLVTVKGQLGGDLRENYRHNKKNIRLPIYMYSHSGQTIKTTPFNCPWDSGQIGFIYCTREKVREQMGWKRISQKRVDEVKEILKREIEVIDDWLKGVVLIVCPE